MKIGVLTTGYPRFEGDIAGCFVRDLNHELAELGHEIRVLVPEATEARSHSDPKNVEVITVPYMRPRSLQKTFFGAGAPFNLKHSNVAMAGALSFLPALAARASQNLRGCDALISHWALPCGMVAAALAASRPHVAFFHSADVNLIGRMPMRRHAAAFLSKRSTTQWFVSQELRQRFQNSLGSDLPAERVRVGPIGTRKLMKPTSEDRRIARHRLGCEKFTLLFLGRLVPIKGLDLLIEALADLPNVDLRIAGDGPERERLQRLARPLGKRIRFEGLVSGEKKSLLLHAADALTLPSRVGLDGQEEGLPTAITEALMHALPGIVSNTGGMPEAITDGYNGFLFAPGDAVSLRQAIQRLQKDVPLQQRLRTNAFESAQAFCVDRTAATVSNELEQSLRGQQRSCPLVARS